MKINFQTINNSEYTRIIDTNYCIHVNYFIKITILNDEYVSTLISSDNNNILEKFITKICELRYNNSKINLFICMSNFINVCIIDDTITNNSEKLISIITIN